MYIHIFEVIKYIITVLSTVIFCCNDKDTVDPRLTLLLKETALYCNLLQVLYMKRVGNT